MQLDEMEKAARSSTPPTQDQLTRLATLDQLIKAIQGATKPTRSVWYWSWRVGLIAITLALAIALHFIPLPRASIVLHVTTQEARFLLSDSIDLGRHLEVTQINAAGDARRVVGPQKDDTAGVAPFNLDSWPPQGSDEFRHFQFSFNWDSVRNNPTRIFGTIRSGAMIELRYFPGGPLFELASRSLGATPDSSFLLFKVPATKSLPLRDVGVASQFDRLDLWFVPHARTNAFLDAVPVRGLSLLAPVFEVAARHPTSSPREVQGELQLLDRLHPRQRERIEILDSGFMTFAESDRSGLLTGTLTFPEFGKTYSLGNGEVLRLKGDWGWITRLNVTREGIELTYVGDVSAVYSGPQDHKRNLMPTWYDWSIGWPLVAVTACLAFFALLGFPNLRSFFTRSS